MISKNEYSSKVDNIYFEININIVSLIVIVIIFNATLSASNLFDCN